MKVDMEKLTFWTNRQNVCIQFFKSQRVSMTVQIEKMTLHSWSPMVFIFFFIFQSVSVFHPSYTRLTWALAYFSSRTFLPSLSSRSVLTKRCSTTWFEGTVTGFFVLCKRKKYLLKYKICVLRSPSALVFLLVLWTSMPMNFAFCSVQCSLAITCDYFSIVLNIFYRQMQGKKHFEL